jgi:hypothetical protein
MRSPDVVASVQSLASALVALNDLPQAAAVYKAAAMRLLRSNPSDDDGRLCLVGYMERFDAVHAQWEQSLMAHEDTRCVRSVVAPYLHRTLMNITITCRRALSAGAEDDDKKQSQLDSIATHATLMLVLSSPKWTRALKRLCKQDGTLVRHCSAHMC